MKYRLSIKINELTYVTTWMNPKIIMLSGRRAYAYCINCYIKLCKRNNPQWVRSDHC